MDKKEPIKNIFTDKCRGLTKEESIQYDETMDDLFEPTGMSICDPETLKEKVQLYFKNTPIKQLIQDLEDAGFVVEKKDKSKEKG